MSDEKESEVPEDRALSRKKAKKRLALLVKKALDESTPIEEARTCSFLALKICQEYGFKIIDPQVAPTRAPKIVGASHFDARIAELFRVRRSAARPSYVGVYMGPNDGVYQAPGLRGVCLQCREPYEAHEVAVWMGSRQGYVHRDCLAVFQMKGQQHG